MKLKSLLSACILVSILTSVGCNYYDGNDPISLDSSFVAKEESTEQDSSSSDSLENSSVSSEENGGSVCDTETCESEETSAFSTEQDGENEVSVSESHSENSEVSIENTEDISKETSEENQENTSENSEVSIENTEDISEETSEESQENTSENAESISTESTSESETDIYGELEFRLNDDSVSYTVYGALTSAEGKIIIPQTYDGLPVTSVSQYAFQYCLKITEIVIPDSIKEIGAGAFMGCDSLESVTFGNGIRNIFERAFKNCDKLVSVDIGNVENWCGIIFENYQSNPLHNSEASLYLDGVRVSHLVIPDGVEKIEQFAFASCDELDRISLPSSLKSVANQALPNLDSSKYNEYNGGYYLGNSNDPYAVFVKTVSTETAEVEIKQGCKLILRGAFLFCSELESLTIPTSLASIDQYAFESCYSLESITFLGNASEWAAVEKQNDWRTGSLISSVSCSDAIIELD